MVQAVNQPPSDTRRKTAIILGSIGLGLGLLALAIIMTVMMSRVFSGVLVDDMYSEAVARVEATQKDFISNETVVIGPYNLAFTIEDNAEPKLTEGVNFTDDDDTKRYVRVTTLVDKDTTRDPAAYGPVSTGTVGWMGAIGNAQLNDTRATWVSMEGYEDEQEAIEAASTDNGYTMTALYQIDKAESLDALTMRVSYYTTISKIVGTEGMPTNSLEYTVRIGEG